MDVSELIVNLRDDFGFTAADYSDARLTSLITKAAKKISQYYPKNNLTSTVTVADQTRYVVEHDDLIKVKEVYYSQGLSNVDIDVFSPTLQDNSSFLLSRSFELIQRLKTLRQIYPSGADIVGHDTFDLLPTPTKSDEVIWYEYETTRTIAELPDDFEEDIQALIIFYIGSKESTKALINSGNRYFFERRGNITVDKTQVEIIQSGRDKQLASIVKSIKLKAGRIGI